MTHVEFYNWDGSRTADDDPRGNPMVCLGCGEQTLEDSGWVAQEDRDEYEPDNPLGTRGGFVIVKMGCSSCGARQELQTGNHKGTHVFRWAVTTGEG